MKLLTAIFLISFASLSFATEIDSVTISKNTMLIQGDKFNSIKSVKLGKSKVNLLPISKTYMIVYCIKTCKDGHWIPGNYTLKLFRENSNRAIVKYPIYISGMEEDNQLEIPVNIKPTPTGTINE